MPAFTELVRGQLGPEELKALTRTRWIDRLISLWAPVAVFGVIFLVYIPIVETSVCTYPALMPVMKVVGLLNFMWWAVLVVLRFAWRPWDRTRKARLHAEEALHELEAAVRRRGAGLKDKAREVLVQKAAALVKSLPGPAEPINTATKELGEVMEKHLPQGRGGSMFDVGSGFVKALAIALLVRTVAIEPFKIPSGSMLPTLEIGDQIFVNKFIYGVRIPFTNTVPFQIIRAPKRGDVIVFNNPVQPDKDYIKRVIGVAGDQVSFSGRDVAVNGQGLAQQLENPAYRVWEQYAQPGSLGDWVSSWFVDDWHETEVVLSQETIDGVQHYVLHEPGGSRSTDGEVTVPPGHVFVMGDNRDNSLDSRFGLGDPSLGVQFVPVGNIKGKAMVIWLALGRDGLFRSIFGGTGFRTDRLFQPVTMCGNEPPRTQ